MIASETAVGGWIVGKVAPTIAAIFGAMSMLMFHIPKRLRLRGLLIAVLMAGAVAAMAGFALTGVVASYMGLDPNKLDVVIGVAWGLGFVSVTVINWVANTVAKREDSDAIDLVNEVTGRAKPADKPAARKRTAPAKTAPKAAAKPAAKRVRK